MNENYETLSNQLKNRNRRKLANNTYLEKFSSGALAIRLHDTNIIIYKPDGTVIVNTGGWHTSTTKERLNRYLDPIRIYQERGLWYWYGHNQGKGKMLFTDGDTIKDGGIIQPQRGPVAEKKDLKLRKRILAYAKLCASKLPLPMPSPGDCWYCHLEVSEGKDQGKSLGDAAHDLDHLELHMDESYVVPILVWKALEERGYNPQRQIIHQLAFTPKQDSMTDIARSAVKRSVAKFLYRRFNLAA